MKFKGNFFCYNLTNADLYLTFQVCGITERGYTYHQLYKYSRILATRLRQHFNLYERDVICVMLSNIPEYPLVVLGGLQAGVVVTTVNPIYTAREFIYLPYLKCFNCIQLFTKITCIVYPQFHCLLFWTPHDPSFHHLSLN